MSSVTVKRKQTSMDSFLKSVREETYADKKQPPKVQQQ